MENVLGQMLQDLAGRLEVGDLGLPDYLRLLLLRDEVDDGSSSGGVVMGWTAQCKRENSSGDG